MNTSSSFSGEEARQLPVPKKPEYKDTKDALSGLFNDEAVRQRISRRLQEMRETDIYALFLIGVSSAGEAAQDADGQNGSGKKDAAQKEAVRYAGKALSSLFRATDILGRLKNGLFTVFLTGPITEESIFEKTALLSHYLHFPESPENAGLMHACAGVYLASGSGMTFQALYEKAERALRTAMENGNDNFHLETAENIPLFGMQDGVPVPSAILQPHILLENIEDGICLLEAADSIRIIYASPGFYDMLGLSPDTFRLPCDLKDVGIHSDYEADYERAIRERVSTSGAAEHVHRIRDTRGNLLWRHVRFSRIPCPGSRYPVLIEISRNITSSMETRRQLQESVERFQLAFGQSHSMLWEVELSSRTFRTFNGNSSGRPDRTLSRFPEALLEDGLVHPDSARSFGRFALDLLDGKAADTGNFIMKNREGGGYSWFSLSYRQVCDSDHNPVKAVGVQERLPSISGIYSYGSPRRPIPEILRHHLLARLHVNLTADTIEELWQDGTDQTARAKGFSYSDVFERKKVPLFHQADSRELRERFGRDSLLRQFEKGEYWDTLEYDRIDSGGNICRVTGTFNLLRTPQSDDIHLYSCFYDTQQRREWEFLAENGVQRDPVSGLCIGQAVQDIAERLLCSGGAPSPALSLIRMSGGFFRSSEPDADELRSRRFVMIGLSFALGTDCLIGQHSEDSVLVFYPDASSQYDIKKRIEDAYAYVRTVMQELNGLDDVRFVSCVVMGQDGHTDFGLLLSRAASICSIYENAAMDMVVFPDTDEDWTWERLCGKGSGSEISVIPEEESCALTPEEERVVFDCVTSMLGARSLKASMEGVLRRLGRYYQASRLYILALSEKRQSLTILYEWDSRQKYSIQHIISGMPLDRFPLLMRCMKEKAPVITKSNGEAFGTHEKGKFWHFTVFPLFVQNEVRGFFCVENAQKHSDAPGLIETMLPYMKQEQDRYFDNAPRPSLRLSDSLSRLPNLRSYLDTAELLTSDSSSSMGALSLDVPNFSAVNGNLGFDYGREMLGFIADMLSDVFGKAYIFRTWDAEFVVLYPNTIMEVFVSRCTRLRTMLQRRYPGQIRIGYTWADGVYTAKNLVREARSIMQCETVKMDSGGRLVFLEEDRFDAGRGAKKDHFIAYFQPKINMKDGSLAGAEALVRGIDKAGHIIPPGQFIEEMEKDGSIRELDLLMLEKVLGQLSEWKRRGLPDVQVSVNISRFTLFNPTTLASILAIQSHFPEISPDQIDLEITETAGDVEKATLSSIVDSFREFGLRFELDDFGSHYANVSIFSNIHFNAIKLDRSLINDLPGNEISRMLVENIVNICHSFGMRCVAEGVETRQQEAALLDAGCTYAQGYYYARPLPPRSFEEQYLKHRHL